MLFLPPYSLDLNKLEHAWAPLKHHYAKIQHLYASPADVIDAASQYMI
jgi:transposase